jgi:hypothetical protein
MYGCFFSVSTTGLLVSDPGGMPMLIFCGVFPIKPKILMKTTGKMNPKKNVAIFLVWALNEYHASAKKARHCPGFLCVLVIA